MALEKDFLDMAEGMVTLVPLTTVGVYGAPSYSTQTQYLPARVEAGHRIIVSAQGKEEVSSAVVFVLSSSASLTVADKVTLPSGAEPRLLWVDVVNDEEGQHHLEVSIG